MTGAAFVRIEYPFSASQALRALGSLAAMVVVS